MDDRSILNDYKALARSITTIVVNDESLTITYGDAHTDRFLFDDLKRVSIITTDEGPLLDDVFWLLLFKVIIMIPQGITGEEALLTRLQAMPGFDNGAVITAMECTDNNAFEVWRRD